MSKLPKIKWRVQARSTGRYRSFAKRNWPTASYVDNDGPHAGHLSAVNGEAYHISIAETTELCVWVAMRSHRKDQSFDNRRMLKRVVGLTAAKAQLEHFLADRPEEWPVELRP